MVANMISRMPKEINNGIVQCHNGMAIHIEEGGLGPPPSYRDNEDGWPACPYMSSRPWSPS